MPKIFNNAVMTNTGRALLSKEMAGECMIQITRMAVGSGVYTDSEKTADALQTMTDLKNEVQSSELSSLKRIDSTSVMVSGVFANDSITNDYHMNEIGLFAQEKGNKSTEILYSIAVVSGEGEVMPASDGKNPVRIIQDWIVTVSNSENATIESLPDGAYAMAADVGNVDELETTEKGTLVSALNETLRRLIVEDTSGLLGSESAEVEAQELLDKIANKVKNDLLSKKGDSAENTVTFNSSDSATVNAWTDVPVMENGEKHKSLFWKISTIFKNVRYLYKILGSEDISQLDDGTVTGILGALKPHAFVEPVNNLLANVPGKNMDAAIGPVIDTRFTTIENAVTRINSDLSGNAPFDIILRRNYDRETASGWKNLLQWYDNNVRTGYLIERANNGEITLYLQNNYGDILINNNSIKSIVDTINTLKGYQHISSNLPGSTWTEIVSNMKSYTMVVTSLFKTNYQSLSLGSDSSTHILCICRSYSDWGFAFDIGVDSNDIYFTVTSSSGIKGWKKLC